MGTFDWATLSRHEKAARTSSDLEGRQWGQANPLLDWFQERPLARRVALVSAAAILAIALTLAGALILLDLPARDILLLIQLLLSSALVSLGTGTLALWYARDRGWNRLSVQHIAAHAVTIFVIVISVAVTASAMMVSSYDLSLLLLLLGFAIAMGAIYAALASQSFTNALAPIVHAAQRLASGDYSARALVEGEQELRALAASVNALGERLERASAEPYGWSSTRPGIVAALASELRASLASHQEIAGDISGDALGVMPSRRTIATVERETARLRALVEDLADLERLEAGPLQLDLQPVAPGHIICDVLETLDAHAVQHGVRLSAQLDPALPPVIVDSDVVRRALTRVVESAIRRAGIGGTVTVEAAEQHAMVQIAVRDSSPFTYAEPRSTVFAAAAPALTSNDRNGHAGGEIGLMTARLLVEAHGGWLRAEPAALGGRTGTIALPRAAASARP